VRMWRSAQADEAHEQSNDELVDVTSSTSSLFCRFG